MAGLERLDEMYVSAMKGKNESPLTYHRWSFLTMFSHLVAEKYYVKVGMQNLYPNLYTVIVGNPATRKSTALQYSREVFGNHLKPVQVLDQAITRFHLHKRVSRAKGLAEIHGENYPVKSLIYGSEFSNVIGFNNRQLLAYITDAWDLPQSYGLLSILGATTKQGMAQIFTEEVIAQGTLSRFLIVHSGHSPEKIAFPEMEMPDELLIALKHYENKVARTCMTVSHGAKDLYSDLYESQDQWVLDYRFKFYNDRRHRHLLKVSMLLALCDMQENISMKHIEEANKLLASIEYNMAGAIGNFGHSRHANVMDKIISILEISKQYLKVPEILAVLENTGYRPDFAFEALQMLEKDKQIEVLKDQTVIHTPKVSSKDIIFKSLPEAIQILASPKDEATKPVTTVDDILSALANMHRDMHA